MKYDPIKRDLGVVFNRFTLLRKLFYNLLDLLLLRAWHIKSELKYWSAAKKGPAAILDAGSGFGQYVYSMSKLKKSYTITAVDVKEEQVADCNAFFARLGESKRVSFEVADLTQYQKPEMYDLILTVDVMEHIEEDRKVFSNFLASLKKGGMLLISTPSDQGGSDADHDHDHDHEDGIQGFIDEHVRDGYNIEDIEEKLKTAGFSKVEARYAYGTPGKISWKLSMKYPIMILNTSRLFFILIPFYYLITFPFCLVLNYLDLKMHHSTGTGLIVKAWK